MGTLYEFKNKLLDGVLEDFDIKDSLSMKRCPYDNAVAETTFKIIKTKFIKYNSFENLKELKYQLADYMNWFNHFRIHSSLGYLTPADFRKNTLENIV